jgi:hypothetical protein
MLKICVNHRWINLACADVGLDGSCVPSTDKTSVTCQ